jgi:hypothetical protein
MAAFGFAHRHRDTNESLTKRLLMCIFFCFERLWNAEQYSVAGRIIQNAYLRI